MKRYCLIDGCENEIGTRSKCDICKTCQQGLRYWDQRSHSDVIERQRKLTMYHSRLGRIVGGGKRKRSVARPVARPAVRPADAHVSH